jgi:hypothetical protein
MNQFIQQAAPLLLALFLSMVGVAAVLVGKGADLAKETDASKRRGLATNELLNAIPPNVCRGAFSFDIWVLTTLFANDPATIKFYNLTNKLSATQLLIVIHLILFVFVASWGSLVSQR